MFLNHKISQILANNKEGISLDIYKEDFYRKLRIFNIGFTKGCFDKLLELLFNLNENSYSECYKAIGNMKYGYVKSNFDLVCYLIENNKFDYINIAHEMHLYHQSLIYQSIPRVNATNTLHAKKETLLKLEKAILLMESEFEDNILRKAEHSFYEKYGKYENDAYLASYYNNLLNTFESKMKYLLSNQYTKVDSIVNNYANYELSNHDITMCEKFRKNKHKTMGFKKY